jgi:hypothetical protein
MSRHGDAGCVILFGAGRVVITFIFNAFAVFTVSPRYFVLVYTASLPYKSAPVLICRNQRKQRWLMVYDGPLALSIPRILLIDDFSNCLQTLFHRLN